MASAGVSSGPGGHKYPGHEEPRIIGDSHLRPPTSSHFRGRGESCSSEAMDGGFSSYSGRVEPFKDQFWINKVKNLGRGSRASTTFEDNGKITKTRADSLGRKSLLQYGKKENKTTKLDWICICQVTNFERNIECRNCKRPKEEGLQEEVEVDLKSKRQEKGKYKPKGNNNEDL